MQKKQDVIFNFHLAVQNEESIKRLNFSRDMIEELGKNFIFLVTPDGDDRLAAGAYDFYSFVKLRIVFHEYERKCEKADKLLSVADIDGKDREWDAKELKQKLAEAYVLMEQAKEEKNKAHYYESESLLLKARQIKEKALGTEHLEIAEIDYELARVYEKQGKYEISLTYSYKAFEILVSILGNNHPNTQIVYENLKGIYTECNSKGGFEQWLEEKMKD